MAAATVAAIALVGCGGGGGGSASSGTTGSTTGSTTGGVGSVPGVNISPEAATLTVGGTIVVTGLLADSNSTYVGTANWSWSTSNPSVATISASNDRVTVTGVAPGAAVVTVTETTTHQSKTANITVVAVNTTGGTTGSTTGVTTGTTTGSTTGATTGATTSTTTGSTTSGTTGTTTSGTTGSTTGATTGGATTGTTIPVTGTIFYESDFSKAPGAEWSPTNRSRTPTGARWFLGQFGKGSATLSLANVPAHTKLKVGFTLFIIRTMDGNASAASGFGPDVWTLSLTGNSTPFVTTFSHDNGVFNPTIANNAAFYQAYPDTYSTNSALCGKHPFLTGASEVNTLGYVTNTGLSMTSVYQIVKEFDHTSSSTQIQFSSNQNQTIGDESWGLEHVIVSYE